MLKRWGESSILTANKQILERENNLHTFPGMWYYKPHAILGRGKGFFNPTCSHINIAIYPTESRGYSFTNATHFC